MTLCNYPIGVFDSGLGGLTALKALKDRLPNEDICYLGDTGRVPYGVRSRDTILRYAAQDAAFLLDQNVKAIVIACGTVSAVALDALRETVRVPIYGVIEPAARAALAATRSGRVGIIGTQATVQSGAYERALRSIAPDVLVTGQACPLFVPLVENGRTDPNDIVIETVAREYLAPFSDANVDVLILGCTHYPLLEGVIRKILGPDVRLVSSGAAAAQEVADDLTARGVLSTRDTVGSARYFVTDCVAGFESLASRFLQQDVAGSVTQVRLG